MGESGTLADILLAIVPPGGFQPTCRHGDGECLPSFFFLPFAAFFTLTFPGFVSFSENLYPEASTMLPDGPDVPGQISGRPVIGISLVA